MISEGNNKPILGIYIVAGLLMVYSLIPNLRTTYDSFLYLEGAKNLIGEGFNQVVFQAKPPLYPIILFILDGNFWLISIFNLVCWGATLFILHKYFASKISSPTLQFLLIATIAFATPLFLVHNFVWTEPLFITLSIWFVANLGEDERGWVLPTIALTTIVALRHMGIILIAGGFFTLLLHKRLKKTDLIWLGVPSLFFIGWQWHTYNIRKDLGRLDHFKELSLTGNLNAIADVVAHWLVPFDISWLGIPILILVILVQVYVVLMSNQVIVTASVLVTILTDLVTVTNGDLIPDDTERYLALTYPLMVFTGYCGLQNGYLKKKNYVSIVLILLTLYTVVRTVKNVLLWH